MLSEQIEQPDPIIVKPSRGSRMKRSIAARLRRKQVKILKQIGMYKEETEARRRLRAKRRLEKQKKKV